MCGWCSKSHLSRRGRGGSSRRSKRSRNHSLCGQKRSDQRENCTRQQQHRQKENPKAGAWHRYPQPWDPTPEQDKHHRGDSTRMQKGPLSLATSSATSRRPPGTVSIQTLSPDWGGTDHRLLHCSDLEQTGEE